MATGDIGGNSQEWQEWLPLTSLTDQLPHQFQRGLATAPLQLTCIDAFKDHLLLGTNVGLVYLAHLPTCSLMRLKCENPVVPISCVSVVSTVDDMVAVGALDGTITIFQLPRVVPQGNHGQNNKIGAITKLPLSQFRIFEKSFCAEILTLGTKPYFSIKLDGYTLMPINMVADLDSHTTWEHLRDSLDVDPTTLRMTNPSLPLHVINEER
ncbi:unnamed protein product, partial [Meganyctiphanes norvegica]